MRPAPRLLCLSALVLAGCAVHSSDLPVTSLPVAWRNAAGFPSAAPDRDLTRWWVHFEDPTLSRLIRDSLRDSPDIASAISRVRQAQAQRTIQLASLFPSLDTSAQRSASRSDSDAAGTRSETSYSAGLNASWELDFFGRNRQSVIASSADAIASRENLHSAQASLASEVALAYLDLRTSEARLSVVRRSLITREESNEIARWRTQAGETDALELKQSESSLEQARASLSSLEQSAAQTRNRLSLLAGRAPGELDGILASRTGQLPLPARKIAIGIPADTIRQRPDVRSAGYQWVAAVARTRSAEADRLPSLRLTGSLGVDTLRSGKLFNPESSAASLISGLSAPIFDAGRIRANIASQSEAQNQALNAYQTAVLTSLSEVEDALIACRRTTERLATLHKAADAAAEALVLATHRYRAGVTDFLVLLDAQRTDLSLQESLVTSRADLAAAHIQLYKALGGGWGQ